jgi:hypothetical protein
MPCRFGRLCLCGRPSAYFVCDLVADGVVVAAARMLETLALPA